MKNADDPGSGIVLVYHAIVTNSDSVDAIGPDQLPAAGRSRVARQPVDRGDDAGYLLPVYATQAALG
ncbi:MAG TPA: hypothetical protein VMH22_15360 [bacterium]|nr:hypothetical protein [bacterium]